MSEQGTNAMTSVAFDEAFQGVTLWVGDGAPCTVEDGHTAADVRDWISKPLQRRTMAARLRLIADWLDDPLGDILDDARPAAMGDRP